MNLDFNDYAQPQSLDDFHEEEPVKRTADEEMQRNKLIHQVK